MTIASPMPRLKSAHSAPRYRRALVAGIVAAAMGVSISPAVAQTAAELRLQLQQSLGQHTKQIRGIEQKILTVKQQIAAAERTKKIAEANLVSTRKSSGVGESILNFFAPNDRRENFLEGRISSADKQISTLKGQLSSYETGLATTRAAVTSYNNTLILKIKQADPKLRAAETAERNRNVTGLTRDIETQKAQIDATQGIFESRVAKLDRDIAERRRQGLGTVADQFEKDKQQIIEAHERYVDQQAKELKSLTRTRESFFQQNRNDGMGFTNSGEVRTAIRKDARARGETVTDDTARNALVDQVAVTSAVGNANRVATGAPKNTQHVSIFNGVSSESVNDFLLDMKEDKLTWYEFSLRFGAYAKGGGRATWDGLKDLLKLVKEIGDTGGELTEEALRSYGIDTNRFGKENLELLRKAARNSAVLFDPNNPEGDKIAADLVRLAGQVSTQVTREVEKTAASGNDKKALEKFGYGTVTVLGGEDAALRILGKGRQLLKGADALGDASTTGRVATGGADAAKAGDASKAGDAAKAGDAGKVPTGSQPKARSLFSRARAAAAKLSNMAPGHAEAFSDIARKRGEIIMVRPVNPHSTDLIRKNFATKGMNIKGKSADLGEHAGTIPVDPKFSKLGTGKTKPTPDALRQYQGYNDKALGKPYETPVRDADGKITGWEKHDAVPAIAQAVPAKRPDGSIINDADGKPIMILADPKTGQPITADYDLFAVGSKDGPGEVGAFDPELGTISKNERGSMLALNDAVKDTGYAGGNVIHHGPANRFANILENADWPITTFTPDGNIHTIKNIEELNDFYATWRGAGYKLEAMDGWGLNPNFVPTGKFAPLTGSRSIKEHAAAIAFLGATKAAGEARKDEEEKAAEGVGGEAKPTERPTTGGGTTDDDKKGGGAGGTSGGTSVSVGGFELVPVLPFMNIAFGPPTVSPVEENFVSLPPDEQETGIAVNGGTVALVDFFARSGFIPFSQTEIRNRFSGGGSFAGGPPYLILDKPTGSFPAGSVLSLSRITGGSVGVNEPGCTKNGVRVDHQHGTIDIDGVGPFADPATGACGHGVIFR